jgi:proline-rich tail region repeat protein
MSEWQPIKTAPRDGSWFLGGAHGCSPIIAYWSGWDLDVKDARSGSRVYPTHWMPLPVPPAAPDATIIELPASEIDEQVGAGGGRL